MKIRSSWIRKLQSVKTAFRKYTYWLVPGSQANRRTRRQSKPPEDAKP
jgi:hypothetical protein